MKLKDLNKLAVYIILFFTIFGSAYNYTYFPRVFSYLKDAAIILLFIQVVPNKNFKLPKKIGISFYLLFILVLIFSWLGLFNCTTHSKVEVVFIIIKYIEFFLTFFVFSNIEKINDLTLDKIIKIFLKMSVILLFVNIIGYFIPNPIVSINIHKYFGVGYRNRITVGQPAIVVFPMILSLFYLIIFSEKQKKEKINIILLLIGIIISISTTGILSVLVGVLILAFSSFKNAKKILKYAISSIVVIGCLGVILLNFSFFNNLFQSQINLLRTKIVALYKDNIRDLSMEIRDTKFDQVLENQKDFGERLVGVGTYGYNRNGIKVDSLENTFHTFLISYGYLGYIFYWSFLIFNLFRIGIKFMKSNACKKEYLYLLQ